MDGPVPLVASTLAILAPVRAFAQEAARPQVDFDAAEENWGTIGVFLYPPTIAGWPSLLAALHGIAECDLLKLLALRAWPGQARNPPPLRRRPLVRHLSHIHFSFSVTGTATAKAYLGRAQQAGQRPPRQVPTTASP